MEPSRGGIYHHNASPPAKKLPLSLTNCYSSLGEKPSSCLFVRCLISWSISLGFGEYCGLILWIWAVAIRRVIKGTGDQRGNQRSGRCGKNGTTWVILLSITSVISGRNWRLWIFVFTLKRWSFTLGDGGAVHRWGRLSCIKNKLGGMTEEGELLLWEKEKSD